MRWSSYVSTSVGRGVPGWMVTESWVDSTASPIRRSSVAAATGRSLSSKWVCAMPRTVTGPSANGAIAMSVVATSPMRVKSASTARSRSGPRTVMESASTVTSHPMRASTSSRPRSPWAEARPRPGTTTRLPVTAAAAKK